MRRDGFPIDAGVVQVLADGQKGSKEVRIDRKLAAEGSVPGGSHRNKASLDRDVSYDEAVDEVDRLLLCDAQTSGGLLFAVEASETAGLISRLTAAGIRAADIGEFGGVPEGTIEVLP